MRDLDSWSHPFPSLREMISRKKTRRVKIFCRYLRLKRKEDCQSPSISILISVDISDQRDDGKLSAGSYFPFFPSSNPLFFFFSIFPLFFIPFRKGCACYYLHPIATTTISNGQLVVRGNIYEARHKKKKEIKMRTIPGECISLLSLIAAAECLFSATKLSTFCTVK